MLDRIVDHLRGSVPALYLLRAPRLQNFDSARREIGLMPVIAREGREKDLVRQRGLPHQTVYYALLSRERRAPSRRTRSGRALHTPRHLLALLASDGVAHGLPVPCR